jgi:type IV secretory pathway VirB2 component (pilin)
MKFTNLLSVFIFIISQNILMASSAYAASVTLTIDSRSTSCQTICNTISFTPTASDTVIINMTATGIVVGTPSSRTFTYAKASPFYTLPEIRQLCINDCETYRSDAGLTLGNLDAVSNLSSNTLSKAICNAYRIVTGGAGKTFAAFAVIATGIGFFTGKVSWGLMIGVAAGIATMFGASSIVAAISGESVNTMCDINFKN